MPQQFFVGIKRVTVVVLIIAVVLLTLLAILAIWDVLDKDVMSKSLGTMGMIALSSLLVVIAAMSQEDKPTVLLGSSRGFSVGRVVLWLFIIWIAFSVFRSFVGMSMYF